MPQEIICNCSIRACLHSDRNPAYLRCPLSKTGRNFDGEIDGTVWAMPLLGEVGGLLFHCGAAGPYMNLSKPSAKVFVNPVHFRTCLQTSGAGIWARAHCSMPGFHPQGRGDFRWRGRIPTRLSWARGSGGPADRRRRRCARREARRTPCPRWTPHPSGCGRTARAR